MLAVNPSQAARSLSDRIIREVVSKATQTVAPRAAWRSNIEISVFGCIVCVYMSLGFHGYLLFFPSVWLACVRKNESRWHISPFGEIHRELNETQEKKNDEQTKRTAGETFLKKHLRHFFLRIDRKETRHSLQCKCDPGPQNLS